MRRHTALAFVLPCLFLALSGAGTLVPRGLVSDPAQHTGQRHLPRSIKQDSFPHRDDVPLLCQAERHRNHRGVRPRRKALLMSSQPSSSLEVPAGEARAVGRGPSETERVRHRTDRSAFRERAVHKAKATRHLQWPRSAADTPGGGPRRGRATKGSMASWNRALGAQNSPIGPLTCGAKRTIKEEA